MGNPVADHGLLVDERGTRAAAAELLRRRRGDVRPPHAILPGTGGQPRLPDGIAPAGRNLPTLRQGPLGAAEWYPLNFLDRIRSKMMDEHAHIVERLSARAGWRN